MWHDWRNNTRFHGNLTYNGLTASILALTLLFLALSATLQTQADTTTQQPKTVCIAFDDGFSNQYTAAQILKEYGFTASFAVTTSFIDTPQYMTWQQVQQLQADGFEVCSHTQTHPHLNSTSDLTAEIEGSKAILAAHGVNAETFVYPYGEGYNNQTVADTVNTHYSQARTTQAHLVPLDFNRYQIPAFVIENYTTPKLIAWYNQNQTCVLFYHQIQDTPTDYTAVSTENFKLQLQYLRDNGFRVVTLKQLAFNIK